MFAPPLQPRLDTLVRNLDRDAVRSKRLIRQMLDEDRKAFLKSALQVLERDIDSAGAQYLVTLILGGGMLPAALCDLGLGKDKAVALARAAARIDPNVDVALARVLADRAAAADSAADFEHDALLIEVLAVISDGARIFPSLVRLLRHPNPHIRSKAVLLIGRGNRSAKWLRQRLSDSDPRIRANAAEALWGVDTGDARELLQSLLRDSNNRVAGNAILGLYRLGDASMIPELMAMARHGSALFRASAAWVMGETGDPRFTETVATLLREPHPVIRKRAFAALARLRAAVQAGPGPRWRLSARILEPEPGKTARRVMLGIAGADGSPGPALLATQIFLSEDGEPVARYRVVDRPLPETIPVVFVLPRIGGRIAADCLRWKRPSDLWACLFYAREMPRTPLPPLSFLRFQSRPDLIAAELDNTPPAAECLDVWHTLVRALDPENGGVAGKRHVVVFIDANDRPAPGEQLRAAVAAGQACVQIVSTAADPVVQEFCRRINGQFQVGWTDGAVDACVALLGRYEIVYQPVNPDARVLKIRVHGPGMCAETFLPFTSNPSPAGS